MKKKLLITGASGFLGWNMATFPQADWEIIGTYFSNKIGLSNDIEAIPLDLLNFEKTAAVIQEIQPDAILHLAANSSTHLCEESPEDTFKINVETPAFLAKLAAEINSHFLFTSSEQVFDGHQAPYFENDQPSPKNAYGKQKLAAEKAVLKYKNTCAVRIAVLFGNAGEGTRNFMHQWIAKWKNNESITVFHDETRSFLSGQSAAQGLFSLLNQQAEGIYHLAGADAVSRLEFASLLKEYANLPSAEILSKSQKDVNTLAFRPADLTLDCQDSEKLGFMKRTLKEEVRSLF
ncbi:MAG: dTDP-4-dehydrorhamnose reductase [Paraglaciecola sp.]|jgi:dTDP-4-dehydrorhamnose reductase